MLSRLIEKDQNAELPDEQARRWKMNDTFNRIKQTGAAAAGLAKLFTGSAKTN